MSTLEAKRLARKRRVTQSGSIAVNTYGFRVGRSRQLTEQEMAMIAEHIAEHGVVRAPAISVEEWLAKPLVPEAVKVKPQIRNWYGRRGKPH